MKTLLDIQKDIRNLENDIAEISGKVKQINDDIDEMRNQNNDTDFDYKEIRKLAAKLPYKKHPISRLNDIEEAQLYLETLLNVFKFDDKTKSEKIDTRLVFIQRILNDSKLNIKLEELIVGSLKFEISDFEKLASQLSIRYKELLVVDLLMVANMNGTLNSNESEYIADIATILAVDAKRLEILASIAKILLCQRVSEADRSTEFDVIDELEKYSHYFTSNVNIPEKPIRQTKRTVEYTAAARMLLGGLSRRIKNEYYSVRK